MRLSLNSNFIFKFKRIFTVYSKTQFFFIKKVLLFVVVLFCRPSCDSRLHTPPSREQWDEFKKLPKHQKEILAFEKFLRKHQAYDIVPIEQLFRQGTDWRQTESQPFAIPPRELWPNILPTLRVIQEVVIPSIGPVAVVSGFRQPDYNAKAGGAKSSRHLIFSAVDMIPNHEFDREMLKTKLLFLWQKHGSNQRIGLGSIFRNKVSY